MYGRTAQGSPFRLVRNDPICKPLAGKQPKCALSRKGLLFVETP